VNNLLMMFLMNVLIVTKRRIIAYLRAAADARSPIATIVNWALLQALAEVNDEVYKLF